MEKRRSLTERQALLVDTIIASSLTLLVWLQMYTPRLLIAFRLRLPRGAGPIFMRMAQPTVGSLLLAAACILPLAFRRRWPLPVLAVVTVASAIFDALHMPPAMTILGPLIAIYTVGTLCSRRTLIAASALTAVVTLVVTLPPLLDPRWVADFVRVTALVTMAAAAGDATRNRRAYIAEVERRAEEAEARAEEEALRRVDEERLRIARELHDITAHSMSVIAVQSAAANQVLETDPAAARRALADIRQTSKSALAELRAVLGVLRAEGVEGAPLAPTPGLAALDALVRPVREAGFEVTVDVPGALGELPQLADASAYRILQEALTNVIRHARPSAVTVSVRRENGTLELEVVNGGASDGAEEGIGHGLAGMRERAHALGGTFEAGPAQDARWRVAASLPLTGRQT